AFMMAILSFLLFSLATTKTTFSVGSSAGAAGRARDGRTARAASARPRRATFTACVMAAYLGREEGAPAERPMRRGPVLFPLKRIADTMHLAAQLLQLAAHQPP